MPKQKKEEQKPQVKKKSTKKRKKAPLKLEIDKKKLEEYDTILFKKLSEKTVFSDSQADYRFKVCLLGDAAVGKTTLRRRYMGETPESNYLPTIGADFAVKRITLFNNKVTFQIWDLAGQENYSSIMPIYYQGAFGALAVFDITRPETLDSIIERWIYPLWEKNGTGKIPVVLIGNKIDLIYEAKIKKRQLKEVEKSLNNEIKEFGFSTPIVFTSALKGENVNLAFETLAKTIYLWKIYHKKG